MSLPVEEQARAAIRIGFGTNTTADGQEVVASSIRSALEQFGEDRGFESVGVTESSEIGERPVI
jgi:cysteine sulfinate desulfinase/cysteine desulfurase-like protein